MTHIMMNKTILILAVLFLAVSIPVMGIGMSKGNTATVTPGPGPGPTSSSGSGQGGGGLACDNPLDQRDTTNCYNPLLGKNISPYSSFNKDTCPELNPVWLECAIRDVHTPHRYNNRNRENFQNTIYIMDAWVPEHQGMTGMTYKELQEHRGKNY